MAVFLQIEGADSGKESGKDLPVFREKLEKNWQIGGEEAMKTEQLR